jgi:hypothetical protein
VPRSTRPLVAWVTSTARVPDRQVRFTDSFFDRPDVLIPAERSSDGSPSATDFLLIDVPRLRDMLAEDYLGSTMPTADPDVRVLIAACVLFRAAALYTVEMPDGHIEVVWLALDVSD